MVQYSGHTGLMMFYVVFVSLIKWHLNKGAFESLIYIGVHSALCSGETRDCN